MKFNNLFVAVFIFSSIGTFGDISSFFRCKDGFSSVLKQVVTKPKASTLSSQDLAAFNACDGEWAMIDTASITTSPNNLSQNNLQIIHDSQNNDLQENGIVMVGGSIIAEDNFLDSQYTVLTLCTKNSDESFEPWEHVSVNDLPVKINTSAHTVDSEVETELPSDEIDGFESVQSSRTTFANLAQQKVASVTYKERTVSIEECASQWEMLTPEYSGAVARVVRNSTESTTAFCRKYLDPIVADACGTYVKTLGAKLECKTFFEILRPSVLLAAHREALEAAKGAPAEYTHSIGANFRTNPRLALWQTIQAAREVAPIVRDVVKHVDYTAIFNAPTFNEMVQVAKKQVITQMQHALLKDNVKKLARGMGTAVTNRIWSLGGLWGTDHA